MGPLFYFMKLSYNFSVTKTKAFKIDIPSIYYHHIVLTYIYPWVKMIDSYALCATVMLYV